MAEREKQTEINNRRGIKRRELFRNKGIEEEKFQLYKTGLKAYVN